MKILTDRRLFILGLASLGLTSGAEAQTITDEVRTRWLRDGIPGGAAAQSLPASSRPRPSALPRRDLPVYVDNDRPVRVSIDPNRLSEMQIQFALDSAELSAEAVADLRWLGRALAGELKGRPFLIAGHTDITGTMAHNLDLSLRRAKAVRDHLVREHGVASGALMYAGFGPRHLRTPRQPADPINRRVEIVAVLQPRS